MSVVIIVVLVTGETNRRFGGFIIDSLYGAALRRGWCEPGEALVVDDVRAAELFQIEHPTHADLKEVRDILRWQRDCPPPGFRVERTITSSKETTIRITPLPSSGYTPQKVRA